MIKKILLLMFLLVAASMTSSYAANGDEDSWTINVQHADIQAFVSQVADMTGKNFVLDPRVRAKDITVISRKALTADEVYQLFLSVLQVNGYAAIPSGDSIKIVPSTTAKSYNLPLVQGRIKDGQGLVTEVLPLKDTSATEMVPVLRPLVPQYGHLAAVASANALVISDHEDNIRRIAAIIARLENQNNAELAVIRLNHAWVGDVVAQLEDLIPNSDKKGRTTKDNQDIVVVADERTNRLLVRGNDEARGQVERIVRELDVESAHQGDIRVIRLDHGDAKAIAELVSNFFNKNSSSSKSTASSNPDAEVTIQADEALNAVVVRADPRKMRQAVSLIQELDISRNQVLIEAAIVEVSADKMNELGVQWAAGDANRGVGGTNFSNSGLSTNDVISAILGQQAGSSGSAPQLGDGITVGGGQVGSGNRVKWAGFLQALASNTSVNLLSTPSVLTLDNQEASIMVGQNVPFVTGRFTSTSESASNPFQTIQREDVGITLKVTPHMGYGDGLRLELNQEVSSVVPGSSSSDGLTTNKREINTTVLAQSGETIVLGGLIQDDIKRTVSKVPLLGDIPLLGALFRHTRNTHERSNLIVFLRPTIMRDASELAAVSRDKYLNVTALQFRLNADGKLEQLEKQPLPYEVDDTFDGRAPASAPLKKAVKERAEESKNAPEVKPKVSRSDAAPPEASEHNNDGSYNSGDDNSSSSGYDSRDSSYSQQIVSQLEDWPQITEEVGASPNDVNDDVTDEQWQFNDWPAIRDSSMNDVGSSDSSPSWQEDYPEQAPADDANDDYDFYREDDNTSDDADTYRSSNDDSGGVTNDSAEDEPYMSSDDYYRGDTTEATDDYNSAPEPAPEYTPAATEPAEPAEVEQTPQEDMIAPPSERASTAADEETYPASAPASAESDNGSEAVDDDGLVIFEALPVR